MDLRSFCVENRRKAHSFSLLRSSVQSKKISQSYEFGMPVKGEVAEEHCFQNIKNMSCNAGMAFQSVNKNSECSPKKTCFDHLNKFSSLSFSKVVGGFVGSKSHGGSASREPHQVWDVILRQLVDTACQTPLQNNLHQYFNIGNTVSHSIFGQFNGVGTSAMDFASYIISRPTDFFNSGKMTVDNHITKNDMCHNGVKVSVNSNLHIKIPAEVKEENGKNEHKSEDFSSHKQSYAEVAKSHTTSKLESGRLSEMPKKSQNLSVDKRPVRCPRYFWKGQDREGRRERESVISLEHSQNSSSQHKHQKKHSIPLDKYDEQQIPPKFIRDRFEFTRHNKLSNSVHKHRTRDSNKLQLNCYPHDAKVSEEKKTKSFKYRNNNMKEKERKSIDFQVHEDIAYVCNMPENKCQNWRCEHNRIPRLKRGRAEFITSPQNCFSKYRKPIRFQSPPPRTFVIGSGRNRCQQIEINSPEMSSEMNPLKITVEMPKNSEKLDLSRVSNSEDSNESLLSSSSQILNSLPERPRLISECSVDSEDSCIVFERDEHDFPDDYSDDASECDTDSDNECDNDSVSTIEDCDEVDFQFVPISQISVCIMPSESITDAFSTVPDRLKDINKRWQEENCVFSQDEKVPEKVHFAHDGHLTKIHPMIHWGYAYREARRGPWEEIGRDRCRFQMRISNAQRELASVLDPEHRRKVWEERCAPLY